MARAYVALTLVSRGGVIKLRLPPVPLDGGGGPLFRGEAVAHGMCLAQEVVADSPTRLYILFVGSQVHRRGPPGGRST